MIQNELLSRLNIYMKHNHTIPTMKDAWNILLNCWCSVNESRIWCSFCDDETLWDDMTEEEWIEWCAINKFPYTVENSNIDIDYLIHMINMNDNIDDIFLENIPNLTKKQKKRDRDRKYQKHLKNLWHNDRYMICGPYPVDKNGDYVEDNSKEFVRYKRVYREKRSKYLKHVSNKKLRKAKNKPSKGSSYKRYYDFWWQLW